MYSWLFRKCLFPLYESYLAKRKTLAYVHEYQQNLQKTQEELRAIQFEKLKNLLIHAYENCDYYRQSWDKLGFVPQSIKSVEDVQCLPVLDKDTIREHYAGFVSRAHKGRNIKKTTGGSSGVPFQFELDQESNERRQAVMWRGYGALGAGLGVRALYLWGANIAPVGAKSKLKDRLYHAFYNRIMLNSFKMTDSNLDDYVQAINKANAEVIVSYVNPLVTLADYIIENGLSVKSPKSVLTGAEPLYEFQREKIQRAFNTQVYNTYGCREFMLIGSESKQKQGLHVNIDHLLVELVDEQDQISLASGDIVITDLHNYGFPLIRYRNGDRATWAEQDETQDACPLPKLKSIDGRKLDIIQTLDGKKIPGEFFPHLLKDFKSIKQFQVVQNNLEILELNLVLYHEAPEELERLEALIQENVGDSLALKINRLNEIPLTASGKQRVTISNLGTNEVDHSQQSLH